MKRLLALALCALLILSLAACGKKQEQSPLGIAGDTSGLQIKEGYLPSANSVPAGDSGTTNGMQMPNPIMDYDTLADAEKAAGFTISVPDGINGYGERATQVISGKMLQVLFLNGDDRVSIRKQAGSGDISGDYNTYATTVNVTVNGADVTMKGESAESMSLATWTKDGYAFSVTLDAPMSQAALEQLVSQVG